MALQWARCKNRATLIPPWSSASLGRRTVLAVRSSAVSKGSGNKAQNHEPPGSSVVRNQKANTYEAGGSVICLRWTSCFLWSKGCRTAGIQDSNLWFLSHSPMAPHVFAARTALRLLIWLSSHKDWIVSLWADIEVLGTASCKTWGRLQLGAPAWSPAKRPSSLQVGQTPAPPAELAPCWLRGREKVWGIGLEVRGCFHPAEKGQRLLVKAKSDISLFSHFCSCSPKQPWDRVTVSSWNPPTLCLPCPTLKPLLLEIVRITLSACTGLRTFEYLHKLTN